MHLTLLCKYILQGLNKEERTVGGMPKIYLAIAVVIALAVLVSSLPPMLGELFDFTQNTDRNPIFGTGLGKLVPWFLMFLPVIFLASLLAAGWAILSRRQN